VKYLVEREIHVIGIQRTGQHAISSWLIGYFENVCYKNNMSQARENPRYSQGIQPPWWYFKPSEREQWVEDCLPSIRQGMDAIVLGTELTFRNFGLNPNLDNMRNKMCQRCHVDRFSKRTDYLLVCRHPLNHYASVLKWRRNRRLRSPKRFARVWVEMAQEILGEREGICGNKTPVLYDKWFNSEQYRRELADKLDLNFTDRRLNIVMDIGIKNNRGSSFDGMSYKNNGQKMNVLNRWEGVKDHPSYREVAENEEVQKYARLLEFKI
jgi:hypothetical protein